MTEAVPSDDIDLLAAFRQETAGLRARLALRDESLARLTTRLLQLERGQPGGDADRRALAAESRAAELTAELQALRASRTLRWTTVARSVYRLLLAQRPQTPGGRRGA
ncbi:MAG: hypothetical protein M3063_16990 [Actinomycetota bacterium]|nr:hypothetical protein [Actinomycetota bacterium]